MRLGALGNVVGNSWGRVRALAAGRLGALRASGCALRASGCVWVRLGAPGSACGRLGSAWRLVPPRNAWALLERLGELGESHASGAAWGAPEAAWERLCVPRALGGVWERLGAPGTACGALGAVWERLGALGASLGSAWERRGRGYFLRRITASGATNMCFHREAFVLPMFGQAPRTF